MVRMGQIEGYERWRIRGVGVFCASRQGIRKVEVVTQGYSSSVQGWIGKVGFRVGPAGKIMAS